MIWFDGSNELVDDGVDAGVGDGIVADDVEGFWEFAVGIDGEVVVDMAGLVDALGIWLGTDVWWVD